MWTAGLVKGEGKATHSDPRATHQGVGIERDALQCGRTRLFHHCSSYCLQIFDPKHPPAHPELQVFLGNSARLINTIFITIER